MKNEKIMTESEIEQLREQYPVPFEEICLYNSFAQILGKKPEDYSEDQRKLRWNKIMSLNSKMKRHWSDTSSCSGCIHLDNKEAWCNLQGMPCTVNPLLTYNTGMIGMACFGAVKTENKQLELEL